MTAVLEGANQGTWVRGPGGSGFRRAGLPGSGPAERLFMDEA